MSDVRHAARVVADGHVGVMVFAMRDPRRGVDESHRLVMVLERVGLGDGAVVERPSVELFEQILDFAGLERIDAAFTRLAFALREVAHGALVTLLPARAAAWRSARAQADENRRTPSAPGQGS